MEMKKNRIALLIASIILMVVIWGYISFENSIQSFNGLQFLIIILIVVFGIIAIIRELKKYQEKKNGLVSEDELSTKMKYKAGYKAYMTSMYMWLFIFLLKDKFPDTESMLGGGILLSALIFFITKVVVKRDLYEK